MIELSTEPSIPGDWPRPLVLLTLLLRAGGGAAGLMADRPADQTAASVATLLPGMQDADWDRFADLAIARHQVAPAVAPALDALGDAVPAPVRDRIAGAVRQNALITMAQIAETGRIRVALAGAGVDLAVLKGWPLAARLYGDPARRYCGDLDVLVPGDRAADSWAALDAIGYRAPDRTAKERRRARWRGDPRLVEACRDIELIRPQTGTAVELHWRVLNFRGWPDFAARPGFLTRQETEAGPILAPDDRNNLLYLSVHGGLHFWDHLKWLADIAALARARGPEVLSGDLAEARAAGCARAVLLALALAHRLLGSPLPADPGAADPAVVRLERRVLARLARPGWPSALRYHAEWRWMAFCLAGSWRQRLGVIGYDTTRRLRLLSLSLRPPRKS